MSIFDKDCPLCGSTVSVSAEDCGCGFSFEPTSLEETAQELEIIAQDEQLYDNYLSARVAQTKEAISSAKIILARESGNQLLVNDVTDAEAEHKTAQADYQAQSEKLAKAHKAASVAREAMKKTRAAHAEQKAQKKLLAKQAAEQEAEEARLRAVTRAQEARDEAQKEETRIKRLAQKQTALVKKQEQEIIARDKKKKTKQTRTAALAAHEKQVAMAMALVSRADDDIKEARKYGTLDNEVAADNVDDSQAQDTTTQEPVVVKQKASKKPAQPSVVVSSSTTKKQKTKQEKTNGKEVAAKKGPVITKRPNLVFKARQAIKAAAAIMHKAEHKKSQPERNKITAITGKAGNAQKIKKTGKAATPEFDSLQRRKTDQLKPLPKLVHSAALVCPHCTAEMKASAKKCNCGYVLENDRRGDSGLVLSTADKEAMEAFSYISITKMS
ncbi:MAG: hypothetical protein ACC635_01900 [Acidiferrobacterales bacterium]